MASYFSSANGNFKLVFDVSLVSQNRNTNTSYVNFALRLLSTSTSQPLTSSSGDRYWVNFNGTNWIDKTYSWSIAGNMCITIAHLESVPVTHGLNGKKTVPIYFDKEQGAGPNPPGRLHGEGSFTLPNIARQSKPTLNKSSVTMGQAVTINTNRLDSSYTHNITYKMGSATGTIGNGVGASCSWTVPTSFANQIPNASSGTVEITVVTKYGSETLGTEKVNLTVTVPAGNPTINSVTFSDTMSGKPSAMNGIYIQNKSLIRAVINATAQYGATIKSYEIKTVGDIKRTSATSTFPALNTNGVIQFYTTVIDSRNRRSTATHSLTLVEYKSPGIKSFKASRINAQGEDDEDGTKAKIQYGYEISSINDKNTVDVKVTRTGTTGNLVSIQSSNSDYFKVNQSYLDMANDYLSDSSYELVFTVKDCFTQTVQKVQIDPCYSLIDWGPNGKSIAFGMMSSNNGKFEIGSGMEMVTNASNALRMKCGDYSSIFRQNGENFHYLLTNQNDPDGSWNSLRPLSINNGTGKVSISTLSVTGQLNPGVTILPGGTSNTWIAGGKTPGNAAFRHGAPLTVGSFLPFFHTYTASTSGTSHGAMVLGGIADKVGLWYYSPSRISNQNADNATDGSTYFDGSDQTLRVNGYPVLHDGNWKSRSGQVYTPSTRLIVRAGRVSISSDGLGNYTYFTNTVCNTLLGVSNSNGSNTILLTALDLVADGHLAYYQSTDNRWVINCGSKNVTKNVNYLLAYWG